MYSLKLSLDIFPKTGYILTISKGAKHKKCFRPFSFVAGWKKGGRPSVYCGRKKPYHIVMRIGLTQMDIIWEDKKRNCEHCLEIMEEAKKRGVELLIFPEMTLTGFSMNTAEVSKGEPEFSRHFFKKASEKYGMAIAFGYTENASGRYFNKLCVVNAGKVIHDYAKIHPFSHGNEGKYYAGGKEVPTGKLAAGDERWIIGTAICYDLRFPEVFQAVSDKTQLFIVIANWPKERVMHWDTLLRARAIENQCYVCGVNRKGEEDGIEYECSSVIYDPQGNAVTQKSDSEILVADIDIEAVKTAREAFAMKKDRKNALYALWYQRLAQQE